ncbi:hypothetical protein B0H63DRAFT_484047 [Podospora didyma]|uniref:ATP-grasp domain-containing protein n=1 Tax=Podospora didyma TaxID=330526 RepID=A0AAE0N7D7_9PEZI|nr:hypothetical protein B0H63DRAFT_484047 [Podospora didyma]
MGSRDGPDQVMAGFPTIQLDTTLVELYHRARPKNGHLRLGFVFCGVNTSLDLGPAFLRNAKYLYQDGPFASAPRQDLTPDNTGLQKSLAMKYLSLIPQRDAFIAGLKAPVFLFHLKQTEEQMAHDRREAETTISVLHPLQRPELVFCPGPASIPIKAHGIDKLAYKVVLDDLEAYPLTHDLDTHWYLNSKASLAHSGLPTPRAEIIDAEGFAEAAGSCCELCAKDQTDSSSMNFIPAGCTGIRGKWYNEQAARIMHAVEHHPVPFVVKTQQTFGGAGTWVIRSEQQKKDILKDLSGNNDSILRKLLSQVTASNCHLNPGSIIITDMVENPIADYGLTFFVTASGGAVFLAASEQMTDGDNAWIGSTINYTGQLRLEEKFNDLIGRTTAWVGKHGYYGPVGIDILETKTAGETASHTGESTAYHIVDLNVRTSGSLALPLLKGHFTSRGLNCASSFSITAKGGRKDFIQNWKSEFESGRMFILSWYEDLEAGSSIADVVVGGEDEKALQEQMKRVRDATEEVTF